MPDTATHFCARRIGNLPGEPNNTDQCESRVAILAEQVMALREDVIRCRWCGRPMCTTWGAANEVSRLYVHKDGSVTADLLS